MNTHRTPRHVQAAFPRNPEVMPNSSQCASRFLFVSVCLILAGVPGRGQTPESIVYDIRFGIIEPPIIVQQDITVRAATSNQRLEQMPLECSGLAWYGGNLLISSDRHEHLVFICPIDLDIMTVGTPTPKILIRNEQYILSDIESMTIRRHNGKDTLVLMSSLSNAPDGQPLPQRRHLFWTDLTSLLSDPFEGSIANVFSAEPIRRQLEGLFEMIDVSPYYAWYALQNDNTYRWGNVEGISFTPAGQTLLCGMRNPLYNEQAVLFAVAGVPEATRMLRLETLTVTDLFLLDLGNRGISDLAWDPITQGYLITAAKSNGPRQDPDEPYPPNTLDSALFWWSGHKADPPILIARIVDMTIEAVCRLGESPYIALGSDEGDVSEGRAYRQSILTILEFRSVPLKSE